MVTCWPEIRSELLPRYADTLKWYSGSSRLASVTERTPVSLCGNEKEKSATTVLSGIPAAAPMVARFGRPNCESRFNHNLRVVCGTLCVTKLLAPTCRTAPSSKSPRSNVLRGKNMLGGATAPPPPPPPPPMDGRNLLLPLSCSPRHSMSVVAYELKLSWSALLSLNEDIE